MTKVLRVPNVLVDQDVVYDISTEMSCLGGAPTLSVRAGATGSFEVTAMPLFSGTLRGSITFTAQKAGDECAPRPLRSPCQPTCPRAQLRLLSCAVLLGERQRSLPLPLHCCRWERRESAGQGRQRAGMRMQMHCADMAGVRGRYVFYTVEIAVKPPDESGRSELSGQAGKATLLSLPARSPAPALALRASQLSAILCRMRWSCMAKSADW